LAASSRLPFLRSARSYCSFDPIISQKYDMSNGIHWAYSCSSIYGA
jgi:hypothetical protein